MQTFSPLDPRLDNAETIPLSTASWLSQISYQWIQPIIKTGYRRPLEQSDLWKLDSSRQAHNLADTLLFHFNKSAQACEEWNSTTSHNPQYFGPLDRAKLSLRSRIPGLNKRPQNKKRQSPSLAKALGYTFFWPYLSAIILKVLADTCQTVLPLITRALLSEVTLAYDRHKNSESLPSPKEPLLLCFALIVVQFVSVVCYHGYFAGAGSVGVLSRGAIMASIYRRALYFSSKSRTEINPAKLLSHIGTDASRIEFAASFYPLIFTSFIQLTICSVILLVSLKQSALPGIFLMLMIIPSQKKFTDIMINVRKDVAQWTDKRTKLIREVLTSYSIVKTFTWESHFLSRLFDYRKKETIPLRKLLIIRGINDALGLTIPVLATVVTFTTFALTGNASNPALIFSSFTLFSLMGTPIQILPSAISAYADAKAALSRISLVYLADQYIDDTKNLESDSPIAISIKSANFVWETASKITDTNKEEPKNEIWKSIKERVRRVFSRKCSSSRDSSIFDSYYRVENIELRPTGLKDGNRKRRNRMSTSSNVRFSQRPVSSQHLVDAPVSMYSIADEGDYQSEQSLDTRSSFELIDIDMEIPKGQLWVILGTTGCGKTSLMESIAGNMKMIKGIKATSGSFAYAPQQPWIRSGTLRENIIFGKPYDEDKYWRIVGEACLQDDFDSFQLADLTPVGEKGVMLSGGQKQRLSLARVLYADTDIVALDDPLSALDAHTGNSIMNNVILGSLSNKTRLLVTSYMHILPHVDNILVIRNGKIHDQGKYHDLISQGVLNNIELNTLPVDIEKMEESSKDLEKSILTESLKDQEQNVDQKDDKGVQDEERAVGNIPFSVYLNYLSAAKGKITLPLLALSLILFETSTVLNAETLAWWQNNSFNISQNSYMALYASLGIGKTLSSIGITFVMAYIGYHASINLHKSSIYAVINAPKYFFDTNPVGRIMNRFTKDMDTIDNFASANIRHAMATFAQIIGSVILIGVVFPYFLAIIVFLAGVAAIAARFYYPCARDVNRLSNILRSLVFAHVSETLSGSETIRLHGLQEQSARENERLIDLENRAYYLTVFTGRWLGLRIDVCGSLLVFTVAIVVVAQRFVLNPAKSGVALSYVLLIQQSLTWLMIQVAEVQLNMNSVQRVSHYANNLENEDDEDGNMCLSPVYPKWPPVGNIVFENVSARYRPDLPIIIRNATFNILGGERIGIVGRSGSGKTSLLQVLLRFISADNGKITIDGEDISSLQLERLRQSVSVIPQEPLLFSGTLRSNLDPEDLYDDAHLWDILRRVGLINKSNGDDEEESEESEDGRLYSTQFHLDMNIEEMGDNLSVGQRSLVSLARGMVNDTRIVMMDEATAVLDSKTAESIKRIVMNEFANSTILTIAHHLRTVLTYDRILVMDKGRVAEFDKPLTLFQQPDSIFRSLCNKSGITETNIRDAREEQWGSTPDYYAYYGEMSEQFGRSGKMEVYSMVDSVEGTRSSIDIIRKRRSKFAFDTEVWKRSSFSKRILNSRRKGVRTGW